MKYLAAYLNNLTYGVLGAFWLTMWLVGIVLAKGFISTTFAIVTGGLWSAYLVVEKVMLHFELI